MYDIQLLVETTWVKICSENVRSDGLDAMRELWLREPRIYRLIRGDNVIAVMGVG